jgi:hypothetical protein
MLRRLGLAISYFTAIVYVLSILLPSVYCLRHGCKGPGELDAFMPAFGLTPFGAIATVFSLRNTIQQIRKRRAGSWVFWPLAIIFASVLLGVIAFIVWFIHETAFSERETGHAGMSQSNSGKLYATHVHPNCYLFETDVTTASLDDVGGLAPAQLRLIDTHLLDIMKSVRIVASEGKPD